MMIKRIHIVLHLVCALLVVHPWNSRGEQELIVAVAANFAPAMDDIRQLFTRKTGTPIQVTVSSSGKLYAQIRNGAPYDLYFSADKQRPEMLSAENKCNSPEEYVQGEVVLWSRNNELCSKADTWKQLLALPELINIGQANPDLAPYGLAVKNVLEDTDLLNDVQARLVYSANVGQAFQYAATGATSASFIAGSLIKTAQGKKGCFFPVKEAKPVGQWACLVCSSKNRKAAEAFLAFVLSEEVRQILESYSYYTP